MEVQMSHQHTDFIMSSFNLPDFVVFLTFILPHPVRVCARGYVRASVCLSVCRGGALRGQLVGILPPCAFRRSNSSHQSWQQAL